LKAVTASSVGLKIELEQRISLQIMKYTGFRRLSTVFWERFRENCKRSWF